MISYLTNCHIETREGMLRVGVVVLGVVAVVRVKVTCVYWFRRARGKVDIEHIHGFFGLNLTP